MPFIGIAGGNLIAENNEKHGNDAIVLPTMNPI